MRTDTHLEEPSGHVSDAKAARRILERRIIVKESGGDLREAQREESLSSYNTSNKHTTKRNTHTAHETPLDVTAAQQR